MLYIETVKESGFWSQEVSGTTPTPEGIWGYLIDTHLTTMATFTEGGETSKIRTQQSPVIMGLYIHSISHEICMLYMEYIPWNMHALYGVYSMKYVCFIWIYPMKYACFIWNTSHEICTLYMNISHEIWTHYMNISHEICMLYMEYIPWNAQAFYTVHPMKYARFIWSIFHEICTLYIKYVSWNLHNLYGVYSMKYACFILSISPEIYFIYRIPHEIYFIWSIFHEICTRVGCVLQCIDGLVQDSSISSV